jgi:glycosyltransferase involved in cell wall biosynthesis
VEESVRGLLYADHSFVLVNLFKFWSTTRAFAPLCANPYLYSMEKPLVSVVLCTYNGERFIEEQVDSILRQSYSPLELIISDDSSSDNTVQLLKRYENDARVKIFYQPTNIGLTNNFGFAALQSKGSLIAFSDQDDVWLENKIEKLVAAIGNSNLVYTDSLLTDENGNSLHKKLSSLRNMYSGDDSRCYILYSCVWGHGMMVTRKLLEQSLPIPQPLHHDTWITFQGFIHGGIKYLDDALTLYRQHESSVSTTIPQKHARRKKTDRYIAYQKQLQWIEYMQSSEREEYQSFYKELVRLYKTKEKTFYAFSLVFFMFRFRKELFRLSKKSALSQFVEILKQGRAERE